MRELGHLSDGTDLHLFTSELKGAAPRPPYLTTPPARYEPQSEGTQMQM